MLQPYLMWGGECHHGATCSGLQSAGMWKNSMRQGDSVCGNACTLDPQARCSGRVGVGMAVAVLSSGW